MRKPPEPFRTWNQMYDIISAMFPQETLSNEYQIALVNAPGLENHLNDPIWMKANSDKFMFMGELKSLCFDEIKEYQFTNMQLRLLRGFYKEHEAQGALNAETKIDIENKIYNLIKLTNPN